MNPFERDTVVTFPARNTVGTSIVLGVAEVEVPAGPAHALIVAETPFHPVDHRWADQPADTGAVDLLAVRLPVVDCVIGAARRGTETVLLGPAIPARRGDDMWCWLVLHVVDLPAELIDRAEGAAVLLTVDSERRERLSAVHTACHLSGLAVNAALSGLWRKTVALDSLGSPDFERQALVASRLSEHGYFDTYRVGRTMRKSGFHAEGLATTVPGLAAAVCERIHRWMSTAAPVRVKAHGPGLGDPREWTCELLGKTAHVACGGTHPADLGALADIRVVAELSVEGDVLEVRGEVRTRAAGGEPGLSRLEPGLAHVTGGDECTATATPQ